jgi:hypothetical protein
MTGGSMNSIERLVASESRRDLRAITEETRKAYAQGLRGEDLIEATRRACAERECAEMERGR